MNHACEFLNEMGEDLASLESRHDKLLTLRQYGEYLETLDPAMKSDSTMVPGCASATYMIADLQTDGTMRFYGDSESYISKGYLYILIEALNGTTPQEMMHDVVPCVEAFAQKAGVRLSMIQSRANVFANIFNFMQRQTVEVVATKE